MKTEPDSALHSQLSTHNSPLIRPGYKQTEVGVIPEDWEVKLVHEFGTVRTGPFGTLLKASEYSETEGVPLISVGEIREGYFRITDDTPRVSDTITRRLPQYILKKGDIVFGRKGGVERSALVRDSETGWFLGSDGMSIRPSQGCQNTYLALQLRSKPVQTWLLQNAIGTTMPSLNQEILRNVAIPIPPTRAEQEAIAGVLSDADALIESLEGLIAKKRQIKQGAMQELLTGNTRLPGFSGEWEEMKFEDVAKPRNERIDPRRAEHHGLCVELEHIEQGTGRLLGFTTTTEDSSLKSVFRKKDVLFGKLRSYLRKYWLADREGVCSTEIWVLEARVDLLNPRYLFQTVQTDGFIDATSSAYGTHMPRSDWNVVKGYLIRVPSLAEQKAIATILSDMDTEIAALEAKLAKARQIKQGMMQELLTGRIRLV